MLTPGLQSIVWDTQSFSRHPTYQGSRASKDEAILESHNCYEEEEADDAALAAVVSSMGNFSGGGFGSSGATSSTSCKSNADVIEDDIEDDSDW